MSAENPLDDQDLRELLAAERAAPGPDDDAQARVWGRVAGTLALPPGDGGVTTGATAAKGAVAAKVGGGVVAKVGLAVGLAVGGGALLLTRTAPTEAPRPAVAPTTGAASAPATTLAPAPAPAVPQDEPLAAERALLAGVAAALRRGDGAEALRGVDGHRARFPRGRLVEEREALAVRALVLAGRHDEARAAAEAFAARFPDSLLGGGVRAAVDQIP